MARQDPLEKYFRNHEGRVIRKWDHYFEIYHRHFARFRGEKPTVLEFGVQHGGSLQMWRKYFGRGARIFGVDIDPGCARFSGRRTEVLIGDQEDRDFLRSVAERTGPIDVVIEDGGHMPRQQIHTFEEIYPQVRDGGVFLIEDLHTSYWPRWDGGLGREGTFMEYAKLLMDQMQAYHSRQKQTFAPDDFTRTTRSMHVYDSIIAFEKGARDKPRMLKTGSKRVED